MAKREYDDRCQITDFPVKISPQPDGKSVTGCVGLIQRREKQATSFGQPSISHAYLCDAHAEKLGYHKTVPAE